MSATESSEKMLRIPDFPGWFAEVSDADYFGVNPKFVYFTLTTKIPKENVDLFDIELIVASLKEAIERGRS